MFGASPETLIGLGVIFAGFCGWLTKVSIDIGKLLNRTDTRLEILEKADEIQNGKVIELDRRVGRLEAINEGV